MARFRGNLTRTAPPALLAYLNSTECADEIMQRVLGECFQVKDPIDRPAGHSYQEITSSVPTGKGEWGLWFSITHVSVKPGRNFPDALGELVQLLTRAVERFVPKGKRVQVYCQITTDQPVEGSSNLFEMEEEVWIDGNAEPTGWNPESGFRGTEEQQR